MNPTIEAAKFAIALAACALLAWEAMLARQGRPESQRRLRGILLGVVGALGALAWTNFLSFHGDRFVHPTDFYHYYVGAKYQAELGYTRLYACTAIADVEAGQREKLAGRRIRDLESNTLQSVEPILADPSRCTRHFSPERWSEFQRDVTWFRENTEKASWRAIRMDHGYNATPTWAVLAGTLAGAGPATDTWVMGLALVDGFLLLVMWALVARAFGWPVLCVGLVFWGTNVPAAFGWTGGSFLRQDWLAALVIGLCLLRMRKPFAAGFAIGCATLFRIYPLFVFVALGLAAAWEMWQRRAIFVSSDHRRIASGALVALATIVPLSIATSGGIDTWRDFIDNTRRHLGTPSANRISLQTLISYDAESRAEVTYRPDDTDPYHLWKRARIETLESRRPVFGLAVLGFLALLAVAVRGREDWIVGVLGVGLIPVAMEPSNYYMAALLAFAFLSVRFPQVGVALCGLAAFTIASRFVWPWPDELFVWLSLQVLAFVAYATWVLAMSPAGADRTPASP
jgi:hypothetical protein